LKFGLYRHPAFIDVRILVRKAFYVSEKNIYKLTVIWVHKRGYEIASDKLILTREKVKEFIKI
jgi:hypothetical protein